MTETVVVTPPPKKRRGLRALIIVLVTLALLTAGFIALDAFARQQIADYVADKAREVLQLDADEPVSVDIAGTSVIAQVVTGSLDKVEVDVEDVTIGDLTGGVSLRAEGVPIDASKPVDRVQIEFRAGEDGIQSIASALSASTIDSVELVDGEVRFATQFRVFGVPFDVGVAVEPFASDGDIGFTPKTIEVAGTQLSAERLIDQFGGPAEELLQSRTVCVAEWLPAALSVDEVEVRGATLVVTIGATKAFFDEASISTLGICD